MLAIIDYRTPKEAVEKLKVFTDDVLLFRSVDTTYDSIEGHPDIFIYQYDDNIIVAPNSPDILFDFLDKYQIAFSTGKRGVGKDLRSSVLYNCVSTKKYFFHKKGFTDESILCINSDKQFIDIPQAYSRCSLTHVRDNYFITSDKGIHKVLSQNGFSSFYFAPDRIKIYGHKHGFFGGTNGMLKDQIYFTGNIDLHEDAEALREYLTLLSVEIINLSSHHLYDGGGIFFIDNNK